MNGFAEALPWLGTVVIVLFWSTFVSADSDSASPRIVVAFRYDDVSAKSSDAVEARLIEAFRRRNLRCTWSVIPFACAGSFADPSPQVSLPLPAEKARWLAAAAADGVLDIAQHGCTHQTRRGSSVRTEYMGADYSEQSASIAKGKAYLEQSLGMPVSIFVPPWDRYDGNTVGVLKELGFECISAVTFGTDEGPQGLKYLPGTCGLEQLPHALEAARRTRDAAPIVVVVFHGYDFVEDNTGQGRLTCGEFETRLDWLVRQKGVAVRSIGQVLDTDMDLSRTRLSANHPIGSLGRLPQRVPPFLPNVLDIPLGVYWSSNTVWDTGRMNASLRAATAGSYLAVAGLSASLFFFLERVVSRRRAFLATVAKYSALALLAGAAAYAVRNAGLGYKGATTIAALVGACVGTWTAVLLAAKAGRAAEPIRTKEPIRIEIPTAPEPVTISTPEARPTGALRIVEKKSTDRAKGAADVPAKQE